LYYFTYFFLLVQKKTNKTQKPKKPSGLSFFKKRFFEPWLKDGGGLKTPDVMK